MISRLLLFLFFSLVLINGFLWIFSPQSIPPKKIVFDQTPLPVFFPHPWENFGTQEFRLMCSLPSLKNPIPTQTVFLAPLLLLKDSEPFSSETLHIPHGTLNLILLGQKTDPDATHEYTAFKIPSRVPP